MTGRAIYDRKNSDDRNTDSGKKRDDRKRGDGRKKCYSRKGMMKEEILKTGRGITARN
jgi:hypothetical protein